MRKIDRREEMFELEEGATDGQQADYLAAELSGDYGSWGWGIVEYHCRKCDRVLQVLHEALPDYKELIFGWHQKAADEDDYFSQFVFEYLAFIAHLRSTLFISETNDRRVIQALKRDDMRQEWYAQRVKSDKHLSGVVQRLRRALKKHPLHNSSYDPDYPEIDKWWNSSGESPNADVAAPRGVIRSVDDWENLVEVWYSVRNNLFHGGKSPNVERDRFLVAHAYKTLKAFMDAELGIAS